VDKRKQVDGRDFYAGFIFLGKNRTKMAFFKKTGEISPAGIGIA
jgi:hypothetical protein